MAQTTRARLIGALFLALCMCFGPSCSCYITQEPLGTCTTSGRACQDSPECCTGFCSRDKCLCMPDTGKCSQSEHCCSKKCVKGECAP